MSLRVLSDQCVPAQITEQLRKEGHQVTILRDVLPVRSPDVMVIEKAQALDAILLSLNGDFSDIVTYPPGNYRGIVAIQLNHHPEIIPRLMEQLCAFFATHGDQPFYHGKLLLVEVHRIRIRDEIRTAP